MDQKQLYAFADGSVRECERWQAPNQSKQREILEKAFSANGLLKFNLIKEKDAIKQVQLEDGDVTKTIAYVQRSISGGGRPQSRPRELRVQVQPDILNELVKYNTAGDIGLLLGVYVNEDAEALAVWHPTQLSGGSGSASKQIDADVVARSLLTGYEMQIYPDGETTLWVGKPELFRAYLDYLQLNPPVIEAGMLVDREKCEAKERNLIFFGAPGTGKSYTLNKESKEYFAEDNIERVTFHPDYSYAQFVGTLKPHSDVNNEGKHEVYYTYTPGPFIDTYIKAINDPDNDYLLVIEELNRANTAAVFGDVFQLLDRDSQGVSDYPIKTSEELKDYLIHNLTIQDTLEECEKMASTLSIPSNMYIWATMNSADQGVFPMDTAFKRRWGFRYMGIDEGQEQIESYVVPLGNTGRRAKWNDLRKEINRIMVEARINEDKQLGPFFIDPDLLNPDTFTETFKNKVLLYLVEDAAKTKKEKIFTDGNITYSIIIGDFDVNGEQIFRGIKDIVISDGSESEVRENNPKITEEQ